VNQQLIKSPVNITQADIQEQFNHLENGSCYPEIANLLAFSLKNAPSELSQRIFGYIPGLFREVAITNPLVGITPNQLYIGEPIIYKVSFPGNHTMKGIPYFYLFCYLKENSSELNVYFQSAARTSKNLKQQEYTISRKKIKFEGIISAFKDSTSAICISDPGHFIPDLISSFYVGSRRINFPEVISNLVESICIAAKIKLENTFLFGSSAGGMGALLSSTYFSQKVQVLAVNAQIITYDRVKIMTTLLETSDRHTLLKKFANRVSCLNRFQQKISSVPNLYLLANVNDDLYPRNYKLYQLYQQLFIAKGMGNQSIFDSYVGVEGHSRPDKIALKKKIEIARISLGMQAHGDPVQSPEVIAKAGANATSSSIKLANGLKQDFPLSTKSIKMELLENQAEYDRNLQQAELKNHAEVFKIKSLAPQTYPQIGQVSADNATIFGKEGWLFINSGTNNFTEYHTGVRRLPLAKVNQWSELLAQRIQWHQAQKIKYQHLFIPSKLAVYPEYYPHQLEIKGDRPIIQLQKKCHQPFVYPLELFSQSKNQYQLYEKQDSHWSFWGCYLTYQLLCQKFQITPNSQLLNFPIETTQVRGDLGIKFGLTETTLQKKVALASQVVYDNQVINYAHQGSIRILKNDHIPHGKMIIFGDSFCNPNLPEGKRAAKRLIARLSTLFAETLNEVHFVWTPWVDYDYIEREKPDFVLTEMAERFLIRVPDDYDHLPLEEFASEKLKELGGRSS
jgi:SGNH hydrolase-like domain, acetyltransferase AlgX